MGTYGLRAGSSISGVAMERSGRLVPVPTLRGHGARNCFGPFSPPASPSPCVITALQGRSDGRETKGAGSPGHTRAEATWQPTPFKFNQRLEDRKLLSLTP